MCRMNTPRFNIVSDLACVCQPQPATFSLPDVSFTTTSQNVCFITIGQASWAQEQTKCFFENRRSPSQAECDQIALSISGASKIRPAANPGSMGYAVVCSNCHRPQKDIIVSFREPDHGYRRLASSSRHAVRDGPGYPLHDYRLHDH